MTILAVWAVFAPFGAHLFRAWCQWLCVRNWQQRRKLLRAAVSNRIAEQVETRCCKPHQPLFPGGFGNGRSDPSRPTSSDDASPTTTRLFLRQRQTPSNRLLVSSGWRSAPTYRGTRSDFTTASTILPPQMAAVIPAAARRSRPAANGSNQGPWPWPCPTIPEDIPNLPSDDAPAEARRACLRTGRHFEREPLG